MWESDQHYKMALVASTSQRGKTRKSLGRLSPKIPPSRACNAFCQWSVRGKDQIRELPPSASEASYHEACPVSIGQNSSCMNINLLRGSWFQGLTISAESSDLEQGHGRPRWVYLAAAYGGSGQSFHPSLLQMIIPGCLPLQIIQHLFSALSYL